jgi:hypothetical protein
MGSLELMLQATQIAISHERSADLSASGDVAISVVFYREAGDAETSSA